MEDKFEKLAKAYKEGTSRLKTWSGFEVKEVYKPSDMEGIDYGRDIGAPGEYPFTRGIHADMFRGRIWTKREVCGYGTPEDVNSRVKYLIEQGQTGLNVIFDLPTNFGIDSDHPFAEGDVGVLGMPYNSLSDMEKLMDNIPMETVSMSLIASSCSAPVVMSQYIALGKKRKLDISKFRGTIQNDPAHHYYSGYRDKFLPIDVMVENAIDIVEYCARYMPSWYTMNINMYDLREQGLNAAQEVAFGSAFAIDYVEKSLARGLDVDSFAPRIAFYCSAHIDFFEEIAKLRTCRRLWARIMKERFGAKDPRSWKFKFGVHTSGCSLVPQQPLNNIIRVAYEAMAAVLGGVQSLHCCSFDEPICLPTEQSHMLALRTQQILAYETGVANVADPLAGSYYIENLTKRIEEEALTIMADIEEMGGMVEAVKRGWYDNEIEKGSLDYQREVEDKERIVVGVNDFTIPPEEDTKEEVHVTPPESISRQITNVKELKKTRDNDKVKKHLDILYTKAMEKEKRENLLPFIIDATSVYATIGEILGTIRMANGLSYDPFDLVKPPF